MSAPSEAATVPYEDLPELDPLEIWRRVQSTMRLISTLANEQVYTGSHYYRCAPHSTELACGDVARITARECRELEELRESHQQCELDEAYDLSMDTEALLIALHCMAAYCSNPLRSGVDFHTNEVIDADVQAASWPP